MIFDVPSANLLNRVSIVWWTANEVKNRIKFILCISFFIIEFVNIAFGRFLALLLKWLDLDLLMLCSLTAKFD